ncbi:hypothetical protein NPIL_277261 [Nephila pilipes]|uniref:CCHC-type domain-containing protein n=1 Tax=Nephila pilipes TaxID=299642 RepID=A0A8X6Q3S1_NEPPI|nr:hypothetical protein NPIL_277261 [Nephila pilipes]
MPLTTFSKTRSQIINKFFNIGRTENHHSRTEIFKPEKNYFETHLSKDFERRTPRKCFNCHSPNHLNYNCPEIKKESEPERPSNSEVQTYFVVLQKGLHLRDITLGEKTISALIDTDSSVSLICEDVSTKIVDQQKQSKKYPK